MPTIWHRCCVLSPPILIVSFWVFLRRTASGLLSLQSVATLSRRDPRFFSRHESPQVTSLSSAKMTWRAESVGCTAHLDEWFRVLWRSVSSSMLVLQLRETPVDLL